MNIKFRLIKSHESKKYRTIRLESLKNFPEAFETDYHEALNTKKLKIEYDIENQTPGRLVFGAFDHEELIGICLFVANGSKTGHIYQIYVRQSYQGQRHCPKSDEGGHQ
ncbi:GNAT family N-acetyltransferase [Chryseobacterium sp.]|jgi:ribosomal protein S18 acetylase RimI-like enzyme|uniref:GNAT family N-acetyltransferase n=1 Tax=Chryseobacterium sp. TaxID=1871047 RepID=UPI002852C9C0|nr:GNAT family N-acetyltransferase [Chryseobacterium sp.]